MDLMGIILLIIGIAVGFALGWLLKNNKASVNEDSSSLLEELNKLKTDLSAANARLEAATENYLEQKTQLEKLGSQKDELLATNSQLQTENLNLTEKLKEHKLEVEQLQKKFTTEFENIANKLLKQNTTDFAESNQKRLDEILKPLSENIKTFEQKVEDKYVKEVKERSALMTEVKALSELNQQMREDAQSLTKALKGDSKTQGNWGELILEKILESSGLIKGEEYQTEDYYTNQTGGGSRLDVIISKLLSTLKYQ